jgi:hypothetical protein
MPGLPVGADLHDTEGEARYELEDLEAETARNGRREHYKVAEVTLVDKD